MDVAELREAMAALPEPVGVSPFWIGHARELRERVARDDPEEFLTWASVISTMFVSDSTYIRDEYDTLMNLDADRWRRATRENGVGHPARLPFDMETSGSLVHQAYHLATWEIATGKHISRANRIIEIGGGYGAMARVARKAGFTGQYTIVDLPEFGLLQRFYLAHSSIEADCITRLRANVKPDLLVAIYSLGEMTPEAQLAVLRKIHPRGCLIATNREIEYARAIERRVQAKRIEIQHIPSCYYILG